MESVYSKALKEMRSYKSSNKAAAKIPIDEEKAIKDLLKLAETTTADDLDKYIDEVIK